jgi:hypothetical protein
VLYTPLNQVDHHHHIVESNQWEVRDQEAIDLLYASPHYIVKKIPLTQISIISINDYNSEETVKEYASKPSKTSPLIVLGDDGKKYGVIDGRHRVWAAKMRGENSILALVPKT